MAQILFPEPIAHPAVKPEKAAKRVKVAKAIKPVKPPRAAKPSKVAKAMKKAQKVKAAKAKRAARVDKNGQPKRDLLHYELTAKKVKPAELMNFSRQAASFIRAGIPLLDALSTIGEDMEDKLLKAILDDVADRLRQGTSLAQGIAHHAKSFPGYYVPMLRSAELTGQLDEVFDQLAGYLGRDIESKRKIKSALTYPVVIAGMAVLTVVAMALFVLPQFKTFFAGLGATLPISTRCLLAVTNAFSTFG
jgi:type IV pilus assembly protein PilC